MGSKMGWIIAFALLCLVGAVRAQTAYPRDLFLEQQVLDDIIGDEIPGQAGVDYPVLATVPITDFRCDKLPYPGYYADQQAYCQVFYICEKGGRGTGFLCPNGTLFNQEFLVCDWWNHVDCARAVDYYSVNEAIVRAMEEVDAGRVRQNGVYYNSRGEPLSASGIPVGSASNYNPLGIDSSPVSPARLGNRYPSKGQFQSPNTFGRLANTPLFNTNPRPVFGFPRSQGTLGALNNRYPYRPQNALGVSNRYQYSPANVLGALNNRYPYRPANTLGAFNNRYPYNPLGSASILNNRHPYQPKGLVSPFYNAQDGRNKNSIENNDNNGNGIGGNDIADDLNGNSKVSSYDSSRTRNITYKDTQGRTDEVYRNTNDNQNNVDNVAGQGRERYRDNGGGKSSNANDASNKDGYFYDRIRNELQGNGAVDDGYFYDRPRTEFKGNGQGVMNVDPSKAYLPAFK